MTNRHNARVTIGTLHRVSDTKPVIVLPADMVGRDAEVVHSINRIMRNLQGGDTAPESV